VTNRPFLPQGEGRGQLRKPDVLMRVLLRVMLPPAQDLVGLLGGEEAGSVRGVEVPVE